MVQSDYIAVTDFDACSNCGECIERCIFGARVFKDDKMEYDADACLGCGLCVTVCSVAAISMQLRESQPKT